MRKKLSKAEKLRRHKKTKGYLKKMEKKNIKKLNKALWRVTRIKILDRDNWTCQLCGKDLRKAKNNGINIHHIIPRQYTELFFDENNLIALCNYCHHYSKDSPHQNALFFAAWLKNNKFSQYDYLSGYMGYSHIRNGREVKKEKMEGLY